MEDTFDAISLSNMTRLLERRVSQKPMRYHAAPRFVVQDAKIQPRSFPDNLPTGPHRPLSDISRPPALGNDRISGIKEKTNTDLSLQEPYTSLPPAKGQDIENKELSSQEKDAGEASDEELVSLPSHERNSDLVRYRAVRYAPKPEIWQKVACAWDQFQPRSNQIYQSESDSLFPTIPTSTARLDENQEPATVKRAQELVRIPKMKDTRQGRNIQFTRPTPGYGGYVSRYPVEPRPPQGRGDEVFVNLSKLTYKLYPSYEYTKMKFAHKGPLSRLVTTTHPFNPFNKVDKWNLGPKKLCRRANHSKFV